MAGREHDSHEGLRDRRQDLGLAENGLRPIEGEHPAHRLTTVKGDALRFFTVTLG